MRDRSRAALRAASTSSTKQKKKERKKKEERRKRRKKKDERKNERKKYNDITGNVHDIPTETSMTERENIRANERTEEEGRKKE